MINKVIGGTIILWLGVCIYTNNMIGLLGWVMSLILLLLLDKEEKIK